MNNKKIMTNALVAALILSASSLCVASDNLKEEFKGNWSGTFKLLDGTEVIHEPTFTSLSFMVAGKGISMNCRVFNGMPISEYGIQLKTNSTREEFVAALLKSGAYKK